MPRPVSKPAYFRHRPSGQARVRIDGRDHYLGPIDSEQSVARYDALIDEWLRRKTVDRATLTVDELALRFLAYAKTYYVKDERLSDGSIRRASDGSICKRQTGEVACIRAALRPLIRECGTVLAANFGPLKLKAVREAMIQSGATRKSINKHVHRIRLAFCWAVENEMLAPSVYQALTAVRGLRKGRTSAAESKPVKPVPLDLVEAIRPHVSRQVWAMVQVQLLAAARPGEIVSMRAGDLNTCEPIWDYAPREHKTEHFDKPRIIAIGPQGQAVLRPFLNESLSDPSGGPDTFVFSPTDAETERARRRRRQRKSAMTPSQRARRAKPDGRRRPRDRYTVASYRRAIARGCELAFGMPAGLRKLPARLTPEERRRRRAEAAEWRRAHCWHPNQLRHSAGTFLRREFGIEAARVILGHSHIETTEIYAEADLQKAREIMGTVG
jgi:Phage integrase family